MSCSRRKMTGTFPRAAVIARLNGNFDALLREVARGVASRDLFLRETHVTRGDYRSLLSASRFPNGKTNGSSLALTLWIGGGRGGAPISPACPAESALPPT